MAFINGKEIALFNVIYGSAGTYEGEELPAVYPNSKSPVVRKINDNRLFVAYRDPNNSYKATATITSVSKPSVGLCPSITFGESATDSASFYVAVLHNKVIVYDLGRFSLFSVTGDNLNYLYGPIESTPIYGETLWSLTPLSETDSTVLAITSYTSSGQKVTRARIIRANDTEFTFGPAVDMMDDSCSYIGVTILKENQLLVWHDGFVTVLTVSGYEITVGPSKRIDQYGMSGYLFRVADNKVALVYEYYKYLGNNVADSCTKTSVLTISDTTITNTAISKYTSIAHSDYRGVSLTDNRILICCSEEETHAHEGVCGIVFEINEDTISGIVHKTLIPSSYKRMVPYCVVATASDSAHVIYSFKDHETNMFSPLQSMHLTITSNDLVINEDPVD